MFPADFTYARAESLEHALSLLDEAQADGDEAKLLAAGQQPGLLARGGRLGEQGKRVVQTGGAGVTEVGGKHRRGYASRSSSAAARAAATMFW